MFPFNAAFVMALLALGMARVKHREWLSTAVVVFVLGLAAIALQGTVERFGTGGELGKVETVALVWFTVACVLAGRTIWRDRRRTLSEAAAREG